eukprot:8773165-Pyramimonas_sp.AAC.1
MCYGDDCTPPPRLHANFGPTSWWMCAPSGLAGVVSSPRFGPELGLECAEQLRSQRRAPERGGVASKLLQ